MSAGAVRDAAGRLAAEHGRGLLVAALSSAFAVAVVQGTGLLDAALRADAVTGNSATVAELLRITSVVFVGLTVYAGGIVTVNSVSVIVAGRMRAIALRRVLGSTARAERIAVTREGLAVGAIGSLLGLLAGTGATVATAAVARSVGLLDGADSSYAEPVVLLPALAVALTTWFAAFVGSRRVLDVTPLQALGGAEEAGEEEARSSRLRAVVAMVLVAGGAALLVGGVALGGIDFSGLLVAFAGGVASFSGIVLGAPFVLPRALRLTGRLLGGSAAARLAAANAVRYPERSTRSTVGLLVAVTLIMTFGVATRTFGDMIASAAESDPGYYAGTESMLSTVTAVFSVLIGFSAVVAGVGLVNSLSLGVLQRTRELGLLRALGFSAVQLRRMVLAEAAQLVLTAVSLGVLLGAVYGWAGAHALVGAARGAPGLEVIGIPWPLVAVVVVGAGVLALLASAAPSRRAARVSPIEALAVA